jgi:CHAD domain-containing protein
MASGFLLRSTRKHYRIETNRLMTATDGRKDKQLHDLRKKIKNSLYQCEAFPVKSIHTLPVPSNHVYQNLQEQLGKWHDWWFTTNYLEQLNKTPEDPQLKNLKEQAEKKTALLKR